MLQEIRNQIADDLIEMIIRIDLRLKIVTYCNKVCEDLKVINENVKISELTKVMSCDDSYESIRKQIHAMEHELIVKNVTVNILEECSIRGDLHIVYTDDSRTQLEMMLKYSIEDIQELFIKNRCFESIYSISYSYPFRLDVKKKVIYFIGPIVEHFQLQPIMYNYPEEVLQSGVIHEDDFDVFRRIVEKMYHGQKTEEVFRAYTNERKVLWYQVSYMGKYDVEGALEEIVGEFVNVQEKKELEIKLHTDELTGCLNKAAFHTLVNEKLRQSMEGERHVLMIIDLDNFKTINDNLGHQFGDSVLREAGRKLKKIFREHDYVGRIGGDEFMVFMKTMDNRAVLEKRAAQILELFDNTYKGLKTQYHTTASIGVAIYPDDGKDFKTLYDHADVALYDVKSRGKNAYTFYQPSMIEGNMNNTTPFDVASRALSQHFDKQVIAEVFVLLSEARDYEASLNKVLALLGLRFNAERCYIFEFNEQNDKFFDNTFEWCADGITPEINNLQMISKEAYQPLLDLSNEEGIFYCNDLDVFSGQPTFDVIKNQGILSFLVSFNKIGDKITSMVGFDDCTSTRVWSAIEIATLMHASKIINQFLRYMTAMEKVNQVAKERLNIVDGLHSYAYIIDKETYEIMYYNQELKGAFPEVEIGDQCYEVFHGKMEQCEDCPMIQMKNKKKNKYRCIREIVKLKKKMLISTKDIGIFEGKECTFFACNNIDDIDE